MEELKELVSKLEYTMDDASLKEVFDKEDQDNDGELSKEEFGNAVFSILKANKDENHEDDE